MTRCILGSFVVIHVGKLLGEAFTVLDEYVSVGNHGYRNRVPYLRTGQRPWIHPLRYMKRDIVYLPVVMAWVVFSDIVYFQNNTTSACFVQQPRGMGSRMNKLPQAPTKSSNPAASLKSSRYVVS